MAFNLKKYTSTLGGTVVSILVACGTLMLIMILFFYVYLPQVTNSGETVTVPNIVGMKIQDMDNFLVDRNLRFEVSDSTYSSAHAPLTVLKQYPEAGSKVKENRVIYISLNRINPPSVPVPDLIDGSLINADAVLRSNELKRGRIELVRGGFLHAVQEMKYKGHPIKAGERVPKGSVIDLVVMDGGGSCFDAPDLVGTAWDEAFLHIKGINLNPEIELASDTTGVEAVVLKQKPEARENICVGDIVIIWIGAPGTEINEDEEDQEPID